jgi:hypothetical protein
MVLCMCRYVCMCVLAYAYMQRSEIYSRYLPQLFSTLFFIFWDRVSHSAWNLPIAQCGWLSPSDPPVSTSSVLRLQMHAAAPDFFVISGGLNWSSHGFTASTPWADISSDLFYLKRYGVKPPCIFMRNVGWVVLQCYGPCLEVPGHLGSQQPWWPLRSRSRARSHRSWVLPSGILRICQWKWVLLILLAKDHLALLVGLASVVFTEEKRKAWSSWLCWTHFLLNLQIKWCPCCPVYEGMSPMWCGWPWAPGSAAPFLGWHFILNSV